MVYNYRNMNKYKIKLQKIDFTLENKKIGRGHHINFIPFH